MLFCAHQKWLFAAILFSTAGTFRSNGILLAGYLWWGMVIQPALDGQKVWRITREIISNQLFYSFHWRHSFMPVAWPVSPCFLSCTTITLLIMPSASVILPPWYQAGAQIGFHQFMRTFNHITGMSVSWGIGHCNNCPISSFPYHLLSCCSRFQHSTLGSHMHKPN